jgi:hypothetical protein
MVLPERYGIDVKNSRPHLMTLIASLLLSSGVGTGRPMVTARCEPASLAGHFKEAKVLFSDLLAMRKVKLNE